MLRKPVPHGGMERRDTLDLVTAHGIEGDCHAGPVGPRQVLVASQATLDEFGIDAAALRANVVVDDLGLDTAPSGSVLALGDARVRLTFRCEVCRVLRPHLSPAQLRAIAGRRGYLGVVVRGGTVRIGDRAGLEPPAYDPVPDAVGDRFLWVLERLPPDRVLTFKAAAPQDAWDGAGLFQRRRPLAAPRARTPPSAPSP